MPSPMVKATLAAAALSSASNILAQFLEAYRGSKPFVFDLPSFLRFVTCTFVSAPPNYLWQQLLERSFPAYEPRNNKAPSKHDSRDLEKQMTTDPRGNGGEGSGSASPGAGAGDHQKPKLNIRNTLSKWFIDCITLGAIFNTVAFFVLMGIMKRQPLAQIAHNVRTETIPLIVAGYKIWPFASIISFSCVPVERRIVFLNFVGLLWGIYMSLVAARV
ncbi:Uu.00g056680.m01.CDS01 [Anthostomella pinea]|uniref:Uu.00g056680.m01.CDS01 n=1 Tax=Anthostomella pinea TaxID=933095 RepID=A0AAI8YLZ4_9PEZI|nr:Uu.00g056680.m01.CDS01 [Anthostomella pinea]